MSSTQIAGLFPEGAHRYGPLARRLVTKAQTERVPFAGGIELTHRCNLACLHCYVNLPAADREAQRKEMTYDQICRLLDELAELGTMKLTLTGGEPLLRSDFEDIYRYAYSKGLLLVIYTNGTLITDRIIRLWSELPPNFVEITQYGHSAEVYDRTANAGTGQHARFIRGVQRLVDAGIRLSMKSVAMKANAHEIPAMAAFASSLGARFRFDTIISPRIDGGRQPLDQRLSPDEIAALDQTDERRLEAWASYCADRVGRSPATDALYQCGAGLATFLVDPCGLLHVCELSRTLRWDVTKHGFAKGWFEEIPKLRARRRPPEASCGSCGASTVCSNCVGMAELEGIAPQTPNEYFCSVTDARVGNALGRPQPNALVQLRRRQPEKEAPRV